MLYLKSFKSDARIARLITVNADSSARPAEATTGGLVGMMVLVELDPLELLPGYTEVNEEVVLTSMGVSVVVPVGTAVAVLFIGQTIVVTDMVV